MQYTALIAHSTCFEANLFAYVMRNVASMEIDTVCFLPGIDGYCLNMFTGYALVYAIS